MKTLFFLMILSFLMNCYSYPKSFSDGYSGYDQSKVYELRLNNKEVLAARHLTKTTENFSFYDSSGKTQTIAISEVKEVRERQFSALKTVGLVVGTAAVGTLILVGLTSDINLGSMDLSF